MANLQKLIDLDGLSYFLGQIKAKFVRSVNGGKPDSKGNVNIANMEGATSNVSGKAGLVPIPTAGKQDMALCGDATFKVLPIAGGGTGATNAAGALSNLGIDTTNFNPTGSILPFAGSSIPSGYLACNGSAISRTTYSALYNVIGTKYGSGDGSTTFNLPNLEDNRFMEFHSTPATKKNAGLPNITGYIDKIRVMLNTQYATSGAFSGSVSTWSGDANAGSAQTVKFNFDASKGGSTLYGASTTVQPKSLTVRAIIKY